MIIIQVVESLSVRVILVVMLHITNVFMGIHGTQSTVIIIWRY